MSNRQLLQQIAVLERRITDLEYQLRGDQPNIAFIDSVTEVNLELNYLVFDRQSKSFFLVENGELTEI